MSCASHSFEAPRQVFFFRAVSENPKSHLQRKANTCVRTRGFRKQAGSRDHAAQARWNDVNPSQRSTHLYYTARRRLSSTGYRHSPSSVDTSSHQRCHQPSWCVHGRVALYMLHERCLYITLFIFANLASVEKVQAWEDHFSL